VSEAVGSGLVSDFSQLFTSLSLSFLRIPLRWLECSLLWTYYRFVLISQLAHSIPQYIKCINVYICTFPSVLHVPKNTDGKGDAYSPRRPY
jgi:hypothetical protein